MPSPRFGLIGDPIATSRSPRLFAAAYRGRYPYDLIEGGDFAASWERFLSGYTAINVTAPFKEAALRAVAGSVRAGKGLISGPCARIGATNLVVRHEDGSLDAHNSDFSGILLCLASALLPGLVEEAMDTFGDRAHIKVHQVLRESLPVLYPRTPQALVVGCGGAGKAAAVAAAECGFSTVLMNRTPERAQALADALPDYHFLPLPLSAFRTALRECDLVIYTLPGRIAQLDVLSDEDFLPADEAGPGPRKILLEANYKDPSFSGPLRTLMETQGCQYIGGSRWHFYQAVTGYALMTGCQPDLRAMAAALPE